MKKKLSLLIVAFMALAAYAGLNAWRTAGEPEVTLDFSGSTDNWGIGTTKVTAENSFTYGGYTIVLKGTGSKGGYRWYDSGNIILGKKDATLTLPAFDFAVEKIEVEGTSGASEQVKQNIFVGETAVSTETTGAKNVTNVYEIAEAYQAAGNVYVLKVTSDHNTQITKINIYKKAESVETTYTVAGEIMGGDGSLSAGFFGTKWDETNTANDMVKGEDDIFTKKYEDIDLSVGKIFFKVAENHAWTTSYPESNYELMVTKAGKYDLTITFNAESKKVEALLESKETEPTITSMEIRGTFPGMSWDADGAVAMNPVAGSTTQWMVTMENVEVEGKTYEYKAFANNSTDGYQLPATGNNSFTFGTEQYPAGTYNLKFSVDTGTHSLTLTAEKVEEPEPTITSMEIRGTFPGMSWDADGAVAMTQVEGDPTAWTVTVENVVVEAKTYEYKAYANHETTGFQLPSAEEGNASFTFGTEQYPAGKYNLRFIASTQWNRFEMVPTKVTEPDPEPEAVYYAAGDPKVWGVNWTVDEANKLTKGEDGKYSITKTGLTLDAANYGYKVVKVVGETQTWIPEAYDGAKQLEIKERAVYSVTLTFDPAAEEDFVAVATKTGEAEPVVDTWTVVGAFYYTKEGEEKSTEVPIFGNAWDPALTANDMTKGEDGIFYYKKADVELPAAGNVELKVVKNHEWGEDGVNAYPAQNKQIAISAAGKYDIAVTFNAETKEVTATATSKDTPEPATISKVQICGATDAGWTNRIDFDLNLADPNVYYNTLDATEYTEDVEFKLVVNEEFWKGIGEFEKIEDPHGLLDQTTYAEGNKNFILKNSNGVYKTYGFKAHWKENPNAGAGWSLEVLGIDKREVTPEPGTPDLIVVGNNAELFGKAWDVESTSNTMELISGKYYRTYKNVQPQEQNIELKAYNKTNSKWFGNTKDGENVVFNMKAEGDFTVVLDVNADFTEGRVWVEGENVEMITPAPEPPVTEATWTIAGDNTTLFGEAWNPELTANDMVKGEDNLFKWEKTEQTLTAGTVEFKVVKNHAWGEEYPKDGNYKLTIPADGKYTVTITFDAEKKEVAAVATKTGDVVIPDAEITSVILPGDWNWLVEKGADNVEPYPILTKGENNVWTAVLDLTSVTTDQNFKLNVNKTNWIGVGELTLDAGELVSTELGEGQNFILKNETSGFQIYNITATWTPSSNAKAGWTLKIEGKDERPVITEPVYTLVGDESAAFLGGAMAVLEANNLEKMDEDFYKKDYTGINLEAGTIKVWVAKNGDLDNLIPATGFTLDIASAGVYDLSFTFHSDQNALRGMAEKKSDPIEITRMDIVGDFTGGWPSKDETSGEWDWSKAKAMTQDATNPAIWTLTVEGFKAEAKTYEYKATANGQYGVYELPASGNNNWVFGTEAYPAGKYDLLFTANTADNSLTVVPTLTEVETVILDEEETLAENQVLEVDEPFTSDEITVEDGQIITIEADEAGESLVPRRAFRALAASDITIQYKPEAGDNWKDAPVIVETNETGYQFEVTGAVATAINDRGFAIKANKPIVVTQVAVVTEVTPDPEPEPVYYAVGVKALWGVNDWTVDEANKLTKGEDGKYTITKTGLTLDANTNYGYKVVKVVGETQTWIPDGMGNEKNLTVNERAVYSVTLTLDPAEPLTIGSYLAEAKKTGEAEPIPDAEITKVEIRGEFTNWGEGEALVLAKQGETNTYTGVLDLSEVVSNQNMKLVINGDQWLDYDKMTVSAPDGWVVMSEDGYKNIYLKNSTTGYKTYTMTATWTPSPDATAGWTLTIAGKDLRPVAPATISKVEIRGEFTNWSEGEGIELTKQSETDTYAGVLDLSDITADQAFKLVLNDKTYWLDYNHLELVAPEGWLSKEAGDVTEPAIILANATTGYKTYSVTATWSPSPDASANWKLEIAGKDVREPAPEPEANYYIVGSMTDWKVVAEDTYKLTLNESAEAGVTEYMKTIDFAAGAEFKVVKVQGTSETWYPDGMDNNYKITNASNYTVYFRPNGDGGEGWHYGYIYVVDNNPTGINALKVAIEKGAEVYTVNGQRVQNPTKGLYIVNGRKVVIK